MVKEADEVEITPSGTMHRNKRMRMLRAPAGMKDGSDVDMGRFAKGRVVLELLLYAQVRLFRRCIESGRR